VGQALACGGLQPNVTRFSGGASPARNICWFSCRYFLALYRRV